MQLLISGIMNQWKWNANRDSRYKHKERFYAVRNIPKDKNGKRKKINMHRLITNCPKELEVDHINGNTLKNTENNLRNLTHRQNLQNLHIEKKSKYPGVTWHKGSQKWMAQITIKGEYNYLGYFDSEKKAHEKYMKKCKAG
jgi:hypothetical protein